MIKILHVEDNPIDRELISFQLKKHASDFEIRLTGSGREALEILKKTELDCVLSDFQMPEMNGLELLRIVRGRNYDIPFIFLTGQGNEALAIQALKAGADDYFTKEKGFMQYERLVNSIRHLVAASEEKRKRRSIEQELIESEKRFRQFLEDMPNLAVQGFAPDGTIIFWNKASENLLGYSSDEAIGEDIFDLLIPLEHRNYIRREIHESIYRGKMKAKRCLCIKRKDGLMLKIDSDHSIIRHEGQEPEIFSWTSVM